MALSPPLIAYGSAIYPERPRAGPRSAGRRCSPWPPPSGPRGRACSAASSLLVRGALARVQFLPAGVVIAVYLIERLRRQRRGLLALVGTRARGLQRGALRGPERGLLQRPHALLRRAAGVSPTGVDSPAGYARRAERLPGLLIDRDFGLLRWAPVLLLVFVGAWLLWRGRRERLSRGGAGLRPRWPRQPDCASPRSARSTWWRRSWRPTMSGFWFPGRHLVAVLPLLGPARGAGLRHLPRVGLALALVGVAASIWLYLAVRLGHWGLAADRPDAPWGPLRTSSPLRRLGLPEHSRARRRAAAGGAGWWDMRRSKQVVALGRPAARRG